MPVSPSLGRSAVIVEDDPDLASLMTVVLQGNGFTVETTSSGAEGLKLVSRILPDLVTIDLNLPDIDGLILCRELRRICDSYLLIITARPDQADLLVGLEGGADDYMTKPISPLEMSARVNALMRRPRRLGEPEGTQKVAAHLAYGSLVMSPAKRVVEVGGAEVSLTRVEFDLLAVLCARPEELVTRRELLDNVWGTTWDSEHLVDVHIANLRRKLRSHDGDVGILTVRGLGYRLAHGMEQWAGHGPDRH